ncbi:hypothetical protein B0G80_1246 [Paraburkholderia sp. BL6669N2]|uniref:hypothetical protein n=1 Tax=Paraburkholderia sp. BL6669N2 TaxID=1938807 RepID=UPI000E258132|nr:hypothetical protein [Paraburkholderia sp. BL6669N2]REG58587.1 hypothetical protein B0G80_1246 [Paraburkholderia sp. BL6669N2]
MLKTGMSHTSSHRWTFAARFRRNAFGWKSALPIQRLKEAVVEIRQVARSDVILAAEGAVLLLEKLSPALEQVDSSSGAMGTAVNRTIDALAPLIAAAKVDSTIRQAWLERLFEALQEDQMPYIERLADVWGELAVTPSMASAWADRLLPITAHVIGPDGQGGFFVGTTACMSALYVAHRFDELLALVNSARMTWWGYRQWGAKALVALGRPEEALRYAEQSRNAHAPESAIAVACETILLTCGMMDDAYQRYAIAANRSGTYLATFRAIARKYPGRSQAAILQDLIESEPGSEGKWFASAKDAGLFDLATSLIQTSPTDPRTLIRAAPEFVQRQPTFAITCGMAALRWIDADAGYEITAADVLDAYATLADAVCVNGTSRDALNARLLEQFGPGAASAFVGNVLAPHIR